MKKIFTALGIIFLGFLLTSTPTYAICPICTIAVGAGLGLSRYLGIDDTVSGLWIGALILSSSFWFVDWLTKKYKKIKFKYTTLSVTILAYILVIVPLWISGIVGHPYNTILGIDKLIIGIVIGSGGFLLALAADKKVRKLRGDQLFNYQKVLFPVSFIAFFSFIFYFLTKA